MSISKSYDIPNVVKNPKLQFDMVYFSLIDRLLIYYTKLYVKECIPTRNIFFIILVQTFNLNFFNFKYKPFIDNNICHWIMERFGLVNFRK